MKTSLRVRVEERTAVFEKRKFSFGNALEDAWRLAEEFKDIAPQEYILPLDALAGLNCAPPVQHRSTEEKGTEGIGLGF